MLGGIVFENDDRLLPLLVSGREYFATHEWNRDGYYFRDKVDKECVCPIGALLVVNAEQNYPYALSLLTILGSNVLYAALTAEQQKLTSYFTRFNDVIAKSMDEILAVFDRAIEAHGGVR